MKRKFKIVLYSLLGIILFILISFFLAYILLNEEVPRGVSGPEADRFANKILERIGHENYKDTDVIQWTFRNKNNYIWRKHVGIVEVRWDDILVKLITSSPGESSVFKKNAEITGSEKNTLIQKAYKNFTNDSFWIVAPHKLFDPGTTRELVTLKKGEKALLVSYSSGGSTPGDVYLWKVNKEHIPVSYQMWVSIIPIGGLEASWEDWKTASSGIMLPGQHHILGIPIPISNIRAWNYESLEK